MLGASEVVKLRGEERHSMSLVAGVLRLGEECKTERRHALIVLTKSVWDTQRQSEMDTPLSDIG